MAKLSRKQGYNYKSTCRALGNLAQHKHYQPFSSPFRHMSKLTICKFRIPQYTTGKPTELSSFGYPSYGTDPTIIKKSRRRYKRSDIGDHLYDYFLNLGYCRLAFGEGVIIRHIESSLHGFQPFSLQDCAVCIPTFRLPGLLKEYLPQHPCHTYVIRGWFARTASQCWSRKDCWA